LREANIDVEKLGEMPKDGAVDRGGSSTVEERIVPHQHRQGFQVLQEIEENGRRNTMDQITKKTTNSKCRLYWCLIEYRLEIQSFMLAFSNPLVN
jgi:hypothetical protein